MRPAPIGAGLFFIYLMKKSILILTLTLSMLSSCVREQKIVSVAKENLPAVLDREMQFYMGTVEKPYIKDLMEVYSCDSICVLQCRASAKDAEGEIKSETIRYIFVKDNFLSACNGKDTYGHKVTGAPYLDHKGIKDFCTNLEEHAQESYIYFIASSEPVPTTE